MPLAVDLVFEHPRLADVPLAPGRALKQKIAAVRQQDRRPALGWPCASHPHRA